jgi:hypothetical protein
LLLVGLLVLVGLSVGGGDRYLFHLLGHHGDEDLHQLGEGLEGQVLPESGVGEGESEELANAAD